MAADELGISLEDTPVESVDDDSAEEEEPEVRLLLILLFSFLLLCQGFLHAPYRIYVWKTLTQ